MLKTPLAPGMNGHAVMRGKLAMVEWLCGQDPPCPWSSDCFLQAACLRGRLGLKMLQCLLSHSHVSLHKWKPAGTEKCAALGDLATLQWLHEARFSLSSRCPEFAADAGQIDVLRWLLDIGIQPEMPGDAAVGWPVPTLMLWGDHHLPLPPYLTQRLRLAREVLCTFHGLILWRRNWQGDACSVSDAAESRSPFCNQGCHDQQLLTLLARLPNEIITKIAVAADLQHDCPVPA